MSLIIQSRLVLWESSSTIQNYSEQQLPLILYGPMRIVSTYSKLLRSATTTDVTTMMGLYIVYTWRFFSQSTLTDVYCCRRACCHSKNKTSQMLLYSILSSNG